MKSVPNCQSRLWQRANLLTNFSFLSWIIIYLIFVVLIVSKGKRSTFSKWCRMPDHQSTMSGAGRMTLCLSLLYDVFWTDFHVVSRVCLVSPCSCSFCWAAMSPIQWPDAVTFCCGCCCSKSTSMRTIRTWRSGRWPCSSSGELSVYCSIHHVSEKWYSF